MTPAERIAAIRAWMAGPGHVPVQDSDVLWLLDEVERLRKDYTPAMRAMRAECHALREERDAMRARVERLEAVVAAAREPHHIEALEAALAALDADKEEP